MLQSTQSDYINHFGFNYNMRPRESCWLSSQWWLVDVDDLKPHTLSSKQLMLNAI